MLLNDKIISEISEYWYNHDSTQQGYYHKYVKDNPEAGIKEIATNVANGNDAAVWNYKTTEDIILNPENIEKNKISILNRTRRKVNRLLKVESFSEETKSYLLDISDKIQDKILSFEPSAEQVEEDTTQSNYLEKVIESVSGCIYVYTYSQYKNKPVELKQEDFQYSNTYLKVGKTERTAKERIEEQLKTAVPEVPLILRVYAVKDDTTDATLSDIEKKFHLLLKSSNCQYVQSSLVGNEWFLTNLHFLDTIASIIGLEIHGEEQLD